MYLGGLLDPVSQGVPGNLERQLIQGSLECQWSLWGPVLRAVPVLLVRSDRVHIGPAGRRSAAMLEGDLQGPPPQKKSIFWIYICSYVHWKTKICPEAKQEQHCNMSLGGEGVMRAQPAEMC